MKFLKIIACVTLMMAISISSFGQQFKVLLWTNDPSGIPDGWPHRVNYYTPGETLPEGWIIMSAAELDAQKTSRTAAMTLWEANQKLGPQKLNQLESRINNDLQNSQTFEKQLTFYEMTASMLRGMWHCIKGTAVTNRLSSAQYELMENYDTKMQRVINYVNKIREIHSQIETNAAAVDIYNENIPSLNLKN